MAEIYRLRWEVELFFRGLKGAVRLDEVRRLENKDSLHAIVYGTLLTAVLAHDITAKLNELEATHEPQPISASTEAFPPETFELARDSHGSELVAAGSTERSTRANPPAQRTFFAVALQLARVFPRVLELMHATQTGETRRRRTVALAIADAVLDGARSRSRRRFSARSSTSSFALSSSHDSGRRVQAALSRHSRVASM